MRIALVTELPGPAPQAAGDAYPPSPASRVGSLATALAGLGAQVTVYAAVSAPGRAGEAAAPEPVALCRGAVIEHLRVSPGGSLRRAARRRDIRHFADQLAARWGRSAPEVVHAQSWSSGVAALAGSDGLCLPAVQTFHSLMAGTVAPGQRPSQEAARRIRLEVAIARRVDAALVATSDDASTLCRLGVPRNSIRVIPPGVDTARFTPDGPVASRGIRPRLLIVAGLADDPGPATALRALADIPGAELVIAGGPPSSWLAADADYQMLARLAGELRVADRVSFTGQVAAAGVPALMRSADVVLNLRLDGPLARVTVEAMACGTPVIAAEAGLHRDAVIDGTTGMLVPSADPSLLARRVRQLLASPMREGMAIAAASRAAERYSWARVGEETLAVYEAAVQRQHPGAA